MLFEKLDTTKVGLKNLSCLENYARIASESQLAMNKGDD